jgi:hypothetical protein
VEGTKKDDIYCFRSIYYQLPTWTRGHLGAAFYLQAAVFGKGYDDFGLLRPVGQDLGGFQHNKGSGFTACFEGKCIPLSGVPGTFFGVTFLRKITTNGTNICFALYIPFFLFKWFAVKKGNAKSERKMKKSGERMKR